MDDRRENRFAGERLSMATRAGLIVLALIIMGIVVAISHIFRVGT